MNTEELRIKQGQFEGQREDYLKSIAQPEKDRKKFIKLFPINRIKEMTIDEFIVGKRSGDSFCYWLERKLVDLGNIYGSTASKFGVYYGKRKSDKDVKYRVTRRFGDNPEEGFKNIKNEIVTLLESAGRDDLIKIKSNHLSAMFKGKILSTYYPNNYLNVFANDHLNHFLDCLGIPYTRKMDEVDKRELLLGVKNQDQEMKKWSIYAYTKFLYYLFGRPVKGSGASPGIKDYIEPIYPPPDQVRATFEDLNLSDLDPIKKRTKGASRVGKIDFESESRRNRKTGERGELVVFDKEREHLRKLGRDDLANKVKHESKVNDAAGYDILSYDEKGNKKYIEVKSTKSNLPKSTSTSFLISDPEINKAKELPNYYVYLVFEVHTKSPKICRLANPFKLSADKIRIVPISYRVNLKMGH